MFDVSPFTKCCKDLEYRRLIHEHDWRQVESAKSICFLMLRLTKTKMIFSLFLLRMTGSNLFLRFCCASLQFTIQSNFHNRILIVPRQRHDTAPTCHLTTQLYTARQFFFAPFINLHVTAKFAIITCMNLHTLQVQRLLRPRVPQFVIRVKISAKRGIAICVSGNPFCGHRKTSNRHRRQRCGAGAFAVPEQWMPVSTGSVEMPNTVRYATHTRCAARAK